MPTALKSNYKKEVLDTVDAVISDNNVIAPPVAINEIALNYVGIDRIEQAPLTGKYNDVAGFLDLENKRIVVNEEDSVNRQAFTIAHELGHLLLHLELLTEQPNYAIVYRRVPVGGANDPYEREANLFAAHLLVPRKFLDQYRHLPVGRIADIFGVSAEVIRHRLQDEYGSSLEAA